MPLGTRQWETEEEERQRRIAAQRQLEEQRAATKVTFGEEITDPNLVKELETLKPLTEFIDELLHSFQDWTPKKED